MRGLRQPLKRIDLWDKFKELKCNIVMLQETHLIQSDINTLKKEWNVDFFISGESTNGRGVATIIIPNFEYKVLNSFVDKDGRFLFVTIEIEKEHIITLVNVYGPNTDEPLWFDNLFQKAENYEPNYMLYAGDWNVALKEKDLYNYMAHRNIKANKVILDQLSEKGLLDIWRIQNESEKKFTWGTKKTFKRARLDYFLVNDEFLHFNPKASIIPAYRSDHHFITLSFKISKNAKGRGSWKFNSNLLTDNVLVESIRAEIKLIIETYALPVYDSNNLSSMKEMDIQLMISDCLFLNVMLCQIRGVIISHAKLKAKEQRKEEKLLLTKIEFIDQQLNGTELSQEDRTLLTEEFTSLQRKYETIREIKMRGYQIRSRAELTSGWEKPSKFFLNLEKNTSLVKQYQS